MSIIWVMWNEVLVSKKLHVACLLPNSAPCLYIQSIVLLVPLEHRAHVHIATSNWKNIIIKRVDILFSRVLHCFILSVHTTEFTVIHACSPVRFQVSSRFGYSNQGFSASVVTCAVLEAPRGCHGLCWQFLFFLLLSILVLQLSSVESSFCP
jgi:hypothetical protein